MHVFTNDDSVNQSLTSQILGLLSWSRFKVRPPTRLWDPAVEWIPEMVPIE